MQPLPPGTDEVGVQHPLTILRVLHQQPTTTMPTHHRALQEVVMHPLSLTTAMGAQHSLDRLVLILLPYTQSILLSVIYLSRYASRHDQVDIVATGGVFGRLNVLEDSLSYAIIKRDEATYQLSHATTLEQKQKIKNDAISQGLCLARDSGSAAIEYALYRLKFIYNIEDADDLRAMGMAAETVEVYDTRKDSLTPYYKPLALLERLLNGHH